MSEEKLLDGILKHDRITNNLSKNIKRKQFRRI